MHQENPPEKTAEVSRRTFLGYVVGATGAFMGVVGGTPVIGYLAHPLQSAEEGKWISLGKVRDFAPETPQVVPFSVSRQDGWVEVTETRTCWVVPEEGGKFSVFNGRCPHLGCAYGWKSDGPHSGHFFCPCHDGVYDADGEVVSGPPPRALDRLQTKVENDELFILHQDFQLGVEEKVTL